jgi:hypothetical protein
MTGQKPSLPTSNTGAGSVEKPLTFYGLKYDGAWPRCAVRCGRQ